MWIPNVPLVIGYMKFARIVSVIFLSYQAVLMLIVAYVVNKNLVANVTKYGDGNATSCAGVTLIGLFLVFTLGDIALIVL